MTSEAAAPVETVRHIALCRVVHSQVEVRVRADRRERVEIRGFDVVVAGAEIEADPALVAKSGAPAPLITVTFGSTIAMDPSGPNGTT